MVRSSSVCKGGRQGGHGKGGNYMAGAHITVRKRIGGILMARASVVPETGWNGHIDSTFDIFGGCRAVESRFCNGIDGNLILKEQSGDTTMDVEFIMLAP